MLQSRLTATIILVASRSLPAALFSHVNRIFGCECKFAFGRDWSPRRNRGAQYLAATAINFEQFSRACVDLLMNGPTKTHCARDAGTVGSQLDGFWTQRVEDRAVGC